MSREYTSKNCLKDVKYKYNYILIDCPPPLTMITVNALASSNWVAQTWCKLYYPKLLMSEDKLIGAGMDLIVE